MNQINNHDEYKAAIALINELTSQQENAHITKEIFQLQRLAIAYELRKYDFTIGMPDQWQLSIAG
ncbi:hypothetical protein [Pedobacter sandarakinus]|uniref:hypothetical protein n=1 Tax=Pedobacter sandarakinus TaxID=353156 RepID=UPI0022483CBC|nr:hypothetical protein [Pedobacter sandarakinus]MCX2574898.1 hypothetical protein [Pedobacter sandarakinus]